MRMFFLVISASLLFSAPTMAANINGEYPICNSPEAIAAFQQAKMFSDFEKMGALISDGACVMVEPDIKGTVIESTLFPKVMVFVPYKAPVTGWTTIENLK